ncbi:MAG: MFS transporter [Clostridiales bacterium]|jgi:MFS family permease|nr:MFS transporter [Clostridiales bacterium]
MEEKTKGKFGSTLAACYLGSVNQAVITNLVAVLFVSLSGLYGFSGVWQLGLLVAVNFCAQLAADLILSVLIDRLPYRVIVLCAVALSCVGLLLLGSLPFFLEADKMFAGLIAATVVFSFSGGMLEVVTTPIVDSLPHTGSKGAAVSFLHSFYAWGQAAAVAGTALFVFFAGAQSWMYIVFVWALIPAAAFGIFCFCPIHKRPQKPAAEKKAELFSPYLAVCLVAIMLGGGTETIMNQYVATFGKLSLGFSPLISDLAGMCLFSLLLGTGRVLYAVLGDKMNLGRFLCATALGSLGLFLVAGLVPVPAVSLVCCVLAGFSTSLLWPGTLVLAGKRFPLSGAWIFALLAIFGDVGAAVFPLGLGFAADGLDLVLGAGMGLKAAFALFSVVPLLCFICHVYLYRSDKKEKK